MARDSARPVRALDAFRLAVNARYGELLRT